MRVNLKLTSEEVYGGGLISLAKILVLCTIFPSRSSVPRLPTYGLDGWQKSSTYVGMRACSESLAKVFYSPHLI